jgi:hypothetical protein
MWYFQVVKIGGVTYKVFEVKAQMWGVWGWGWGGVKGGRCGLLLSKILSIKFMMIILLLFLQKQSLAFAVYLLGISTLLTGLASGKNSDFFHTQKGMK